MLTLQLSVCAVKIVCDNWYMVWKLIIKAFQTLIILHWIKHHNVINVTCVQNIYIINLEQVQTKSNMISNFALISNILNLLFNLIKVINSDIDFCVYRLCQSRYWAPFQNLSFCLFIPQYKSFRVPYVIAIKEPYFCCRFSKRSLRGFRLFITLSRLL